jgi:CubicO group peptidase (beta-lactamase class C family)
MLRRICINPVIALVIVGTAFSLSLAPTEAQTLTATGSDAGPHFRADGPKADAFGRNEGYPFCAGQAYVHELRCRVGAFSQFDTLFPSRVIAASKLPARLGRAISEPSIRYVWAGQNRTLDQYLDAHPVTGFLVAKDDKILVERYQYGRTDRHRLTSFSMAKTVVALLIGIAVQEGAITSVDDLAHDYVPSLKGTEYGRTPIKALLQMTSGVSFSEGYAFGEVYPDTTNDIITLSALTLGQHPGGSLSAVKRFNTRIAQPGQTFSYSSADSLVLGLVLAGSTRSTVSAYASEKLWGPLGAEADATWAIDAQGQEITYAYINAVLRDWARLGLLLAHYGTWQGRSVVPRQWLAASIGLGSPHPGYGYQVWLLSRDPPVFALRGLRGQFVIVDPQTKLVLVQTALAGDDQAALELFALWSALSSQLP